MEQRGNLSDYFQNPTISILRLVVRPTFKCRSYSTKRLVWVGVPMLLGEGVEASAFWKSCAPNGDLFEYSQETDTDSMDCSDLGGLGDLFTGGTPPGSALWSM